MGVAHVKRPDIQGIRGIAIASVLAFHLRPLDFPTGFIGVDIFFVLSGYLMSSILSRESTINMKVLSSFYLRRFKRIVPLYAVLLCCLFVVVPLIFFGRDVLSPLTWWLFRFLGDVVWAALFATNIESIVEQHDYWSEVFDSNVLTHTWSLGVEIQYYVVVPLIVGIQRILGRRWGRLFLVLVAGMSLWCFLSSSDTFSFNGLPSRVWQFLSGSLAFEYEEVQTSRVTRVTHLTKKAADDLVDPLLVKDVEEGEGTEEEETGETEGDKQGTAINDLERLMVFAAVSFLFLICLLPTNNFIDSSFLRILAISLTGLILNFGANPDMHTWPISNRGMVYLGDLSYVVYLVHWPVIVSWKSYYDETELSYEEVLFCLLFTLLISIVVHHTMEQFFIRSSTTTAVVVVSLLYSSMLLATLLHVPQSIAHARESSMDKNEAIQWNQQEAKKVYYAMRPFKECVDDPEGAALAGGYTKQPPYKCAVIDRNSTSEVDILVIGNSLADRASAVLYEIFKGRTRTFRLFAESGCRPLKHNCNPFYEAALKLVQNMRPTLLFMTWDEDAKMSLPIENIDTDKHLIEFRQFIRNFSNYTQHIVLDELYATPNKAVGVADSLYKRLVRDQSLDDFKSNYQEFLTAKGSYFRRLDALTDIPNLVRHNVSGPLCAEERNTCWWYNRRTLHAYFSDNLHLSPEGLRLVRPSYEDIIHRLIPKLTINKLKS